jgi:hypothetical protein
MFLPLQAGLSPYVRQLYCPSHKPSKTVPLRPH